MAKFGELKHNLELRGIVESGGVFYHIAEITEGEQAGTHMYFCWNTDKDAVEILENDAYCSKYSLAQLQNMDSKATHLYRDALALLASGSVVATPINEVF